MKNIIEKIISDIVYRSAKWKLEEVTSRSRNRMRIERMRVEKMRVRRSGVETMGMKRMRVEKTLGE